MAAMSPSCRACGTELAGTAKFCPGCGTTVAVGEGAGARTCGICGQPLAPQARYCPACGNAADGDHERDDEDEPLPPDAYVDAVIAILAVDGAIVLINGPSVRRRLRLEAIADVGGLLPFGDRERLIHTLSELINQEGYLYADVTDTQGSRAAVWHILNGEIFGLRAGHAEAVLFSFDSLTPTRWFPQRFDELMDAPDLLQDEG
jgi:Double zinc ribbon